jgi:hypothetical protein
MSKMTGCGHNASSFFRIPWRRGHGFHVAELCIACGANVRGSGIWVPGREVKDSDLLPVWKKIGVSGGRENGS